MDGCTSNKVCGLLLISIHSGLKGIGDMARTQYLVYILVDEDNSIRYVGRGTHARAISHGEDDWNPGLAKAYEEGHLSELVLDCGTEHAMKVTESALISALMEYNTDKPLENQKLEEHRFQPSRVPAPFADRAAFPVLNPRMVAEEVGGSVLYVRIGGWEKSPYAHHDAIDPLRPTSTAIANRIEANWAIDAWLEGWREDPASAPRAVIGLAGSTHNRYIIGALDLSSADWPEPAGHGRQALPWEKLGQPATDSDIDAYGLCGRRFTGVTFRQDWPSHVRLYDSEGNKVPKP